MYVYHKDIPFYDADKDIWSTKSFDTQKDFTDYIFINCFRELGDYGFDKTTKKWNELSTKWTRDGKYTDHPIGSATYNQFWQDEEDKLRLGIIWKSGDRIWYITRCYYDLLNFSPIINKEKNFNLTFCDIRDVQYHLLLYIKLAECNHKHAAIVKRRQMMNSYCMVAKSKNYLWFEEQKPIKWFASDTGYIDDVKGSWKILNTYKNHMIKHTPWFRKFTPGQYPQIQQKEEYKVKGQWVTEGSESTISAFSTKNSANNGVGGPLYFGWYEEGGIAPTADTTKVYLDPAMQSGTSTVGIFVISGSVGDLTDCDPLKKMIYEPDSYNIFKVPTKWDEKDGLVKELGLFIPAQYGLPEATDAFGNSQEDLGLEVLKNLDILWRKLPPKDYILIKSQNPTTLKDAFAFRNVSDFDVAMIERKQEAINILNKEKKWDIQPIRCLLYQDNEGKTQYQTKDLPEEIEYPVNEKQLDKRGIVIIFEPPDKNAPFLTYFGGVDPVEVGVTTTSKSVFSISIWKRPCEQEVLNDDGSIGIQITGDKLVACWRGRFDSIDKTNEYAELLIRHYNAYTLVERNKPNFINHMQRRGLTHYLVQENELPMFKDQPTRIGTSAYGFYKGSKGLASETFKQFKLMFKEYIYAEYGYITIPNKDGIQLETIIKTFRGIDRIPDYWLLEELKLYNDNNIDNFDRIISDFAGYYIMKLFSLQNGINRIKIKDPKKIKISNNKFLYDYIGNQSNNSSYNYMEY